jgi:hypothetical protein
VFYSMPSRGWRPPQQLLPQHPPQQESSFLRRPLPLLPLPPTTVAKGRVRERGRGKRKTRTMTLMAPATIIGATTPRHGPPSTIPGPAPSRCGPGCALLSSRCVHRSTACLLHQHTMAPPTALLSCPCRRLHHTSSRLRPLPSCPVWAYGISSH